MGINIQMQMKVELKDIIKLLEGNWTQIEAPIFKIDTSFNKEEIIRKVDELLREKN